MTVLTFMKYLRGIFNINLQSRTVHKAIIKSIYDAFVIVDSDLDLMRLEMCLSTATGKWLDYWGEFFTVYRKHNESDSKYSKRIIDSITKPKATVPAIKDYIVEYLNETNNKNYNRSNVTIKEPWVELGKYSHKGTLSNSTRMFSQDYWTHAIIDISIPDKITAELLEIVKSVKAAGVKVIWSFLNSYPIVEGFNKSDEAFADYFHHILQQTKRELYSGLVLSNTSKNYTLSGRQELWTNYHTDYLWYANMFDKDTDSSIIITKFDLIGLLDYYEIEETILHKDMFLALKTSIDRMNSDKVLSGKLTDVEITTKYIEITEKLLKSIKCMDDWMTLSHERKLSVDGVMFQFTATHEVYVRILESLKKFKEKNPKYYNSVQPPILNGEPAMWYVKPHLNWLWDTPTMSQAEVFEMWESSKDEEINLNDIENYERNRNVGYIPFGFTYQPPLVIQGSPWYWTPETEESWLFGSENLTVDNLEDIYRNKFSGWSDQVDIETTYTKNRETDFIMSRNGVLSPVRNILKVTTESDSKQSFTLSKVGNLSHQKFMSGEAACIKQEIVENKEFKGCKYISGNVSLVNKIRHVKENVPTIEKLIEYEERLDNNLFEFSTRENCQSPITIGELAMWMVEANKSKLWNSKAFSNKEIQEYWKKSGDKEFDEEYKNDQTMYQPPIQMSDKPWYWTPEVDENWLFSSETLRNQDLVEFFRSKFCENPDLFPNIVETKEILTRNPVREFRLSDNGVSSSIKFEKLEHITKHEENSFVLSQNSIMSNRLTEYRTETYKFISGDKSDVKVETVIKEKLGFNHVLSGDVTKVTKKTELLEKEPTIEILLELEEKMNKQQYFTTDKFQSEMQIVSNT